MLLKYHHLGVAVRVLDKAIAWYGDCLGYNLISGPLDDPLQKVSVALLGTEDPVDNVLTKNIGAYHVCYEVDDLAAAVAHAVDKGCFLVSGPTPAVAFARRRIAWLFTPVHKLIELLEAAGDDAAGGLPAAGG